MKIQYLGTAAAEGWPGLFCTCEACETARRLKGRNIRTRSQAAVYSGEVEYDDPNEFLLIDLPPDTYLHILQHGLRLDKTGHLLITHSHEDHFMTDQIALRRHPFANPIPDFTLHIYGNDKVYKKYLDSIGRINDNRPLGIEFHELESFKPFTAGVFTVTPLLALHDRTERCLFYMIEHENKRLLYGHDTGIFPDETWDYIAGKQFDLVSLDCTNGPEPEGKNHMGMPDALEIKKRMESLGCLKPDTKIILNHFSHNGKACYDSMVDLAAPHNFGVSYDGAVLEV